jgi:integrase
VADTTPALVAECRDALARGERIPRSNTTVSLYLAVLSHVFTIAVQEWQWCDDSPIRKVRKPRLPRGRVRFLSDDERQRLLESYQASRNRSLFLVVVLALATGARKGELLGLRWPDVKLQRGMLTFQETNVFQIVPASASIARLTTNVPRVLRERSQWMYWRGEDRIDS